MGADGKSLERRQSTDHALLPCQRSVHAGLGGKSGGPRTAHFSLAQKQHRTPNDDGVRSRSRRAGYHRAVLSGRVMASRFVSPNETEIVREKERLQRRSEKNK